MAPSISREFNPDVDIPDLSGKVIIVTGANIGLGKASCIALANHNPEHLYLFCRSAQKAAIAIEEVHAVAPKANVSFIECDLSSLSSVKKAAEEFKSRSSRLDILMCNAGVNWVHPELTVDGYEMMFGTNHLGHALLIKLLLPNCVKTASEPNSDVRIVILSSSAHRHAPKSGIAFKDLKTALSQFPFFKRYGQSKLANALYARSLAEKYPTIKTSTFWRIFWWNFTVLHKIMMRFTGSGWHTPEDGAKTQLWAATGKEDEVVSGMYYEPVGVSGTDSKLLKDKKLKEELWDWTETQLEKYSVS